MNQPDNSLDLLLESVDLDLDDTVALENSMPGGPRGFLGTWGLAHYQKAVVELLRNKIKAAMVLHREVNPLPAVQEVKQTHWQPIDIAPTDNERALYLARFDDEGKMVELDFNGGWEYWQESFEMPHINGYDWVSNNGIENPTHWAYQDEPLPTSRPPVPTSALLPKAWFAYSKGSGYQQFPTLPAAVEEAQDELDQERDFANVDGEWSENASTIVWGEVLGSVEPRRDKSGSYEMCLTSHELPAVKEA